MNPCLLVTGLLAAGAACSSNAAAPPPDFNPLEACFRPRHSLQVSSDDDLRRFVAAHAGETIHSLDLRMSACTADGLASLRELDGLYALTLSGSWPSTPVAGKDGHFEFAAPLGDAMVREIAGIESLRGLLLWYGSLSPRQTEMLARERPECRVFPNVNKL